VHVVAKKVACRGGLIVGSNRGYRLASPRPSSTHSSAAILQQWLSDDGASGWHWSAHFCTAEVL